MSAKRALMFSLSCASHPRYLQASFSATYLYHYVFFLEPLFVPVGFEPYTMVTLGQERKNQRYTRGDVAWNSLQVFPGLCFRRHRLPQWERFVNVRPLHFPTWSVMAYVAW
jgi:hypothetical protein